MKVLKIILFITVFFIVRKFIEILNDWVLRSDMTFEEKDRLYKFMSFLRIIFFVFEPKEMYI